MPTPRWVEVQGAILHPPAQMQTQGPEQPQDMAAPEDGKVGSWRQTLDAEFLICHHLLSMGIANSCVVFCFCVVFHVLFVAKS